MDKYDPSVIEPKWQKVWEENGLNIIDIKKAKKPFYNLMMYPYPSAEGLHVGNMYAFTAADIYGRFKRFQGYDVFEPIGLDGFGIHSENYALKTGKHPKDHAAATEINFYRQLHKIGNMFDWSKTVETYSNSYYKWTQWLFVQMFKAGLAYRGKSNVNFCPKCKTVLSDEQVIDEKCERCSTVVEKKEMEQWFFKITAYADRLLKNLDNLDWTSKVKLTQKNWIGRKEGMKIEFKIARHPGSRQRRLIGSSKIDASGEASSSLIASLQHDEFIEIFTTRPETILGATFVVLSPNHPFVKEKKILSLRSRMTSEGINTGYKVINPATKKEIPVFVDEYVLDTVGTGAIMGVPAYDERDAAFAKKMGLPIIKAPMTNLSNLSNLTKPTVIYHLRDWLVSRQRYWGAPIPMINCSKCGWQPVPEDQLPVLLPDITDYVPEGNGKGPLEKHPEFYKTVCPKCGGEAKRETDVSDVFVDSSWYFLRYPSVGLENADKLPFDKEMTKKWLPVDMYTGGPEHAVLHLMYSRFVTMVLKDQEFIDFDEPFKKFFAHGMLIKDGAKMSKSKGNVINPDEYIEKYGADAIRLYLMFMGPVSEGGDFRDTSMHGMRRWVDRVYRIISANFTNLSNQTNSLVENELNKLVKKAEIDFESRHYNTTIAKMMEFVNLIMAENLSLTTDQIKKFLIVLAPFAPHLSEELWSNKSNSIHSQLWPEVNEANLTEETVTIIVSVNGKARDIMKISTQDKEMLEKDRIIQTAQTREKVVKYLDGKTIKKIIYVPNKVLNLVV